MSWKLFSAELSPEMITMLERAAQDRRPHPNLTGGVALYLDDEGLRAARAFTELCAVDPQYCEELNCAAKVLPASMFAALVLVFGARIGLERLEALMQWPQRSAKLVIAIALQELIRRNVI